MIPWDIHEMLATVLYAIIVGLSLGLIWDLFRFLRIIVPNNVQIIATAIVDIAFFLAAAIIVSVFVFETCYGFARGYAIFGVAIGFIFWRFTLGRLTLRIEWLLRRVIYTILSWVFKRLLCPMTKIIVKMYKSISSVAFRKKLKG